MIKRNGIMVRTPRTKEQFSVGDIGFFKNGKILVPRRSPLTILKEADFGTINITNQKNGRMGQTIHNESTDECGAVGFFPMLVMKIHSFVTT